MADGPVGLVRTAAVVAVAVLSRPMAIPADTLIQGMAVGSYPRRTIIRTVTWKGAGGRRSATHLSPGRPTLPPAPTVPPGIGRAPSTHRICHRHTPMLASRGRRWEALPQHHQSPRRGRQVRPKWGRCGIGCERRKRKHRKGAKRLRRWRKPQPRRTMLTHAEPPEASQRAAAAMDATEIGGGLTPDILRGSGGIETQAPVVAGTEEVIISARVVAMLGNGGRRSKS